MKIIGITGPTGAGKTTALGALTALGACIIDADAVYHRLLEESAPLREALTARFGDICDQMGRIDRKKLGEQVFTDPAALADLNGITHRFVGEAVPPPPLTPSRSLRADLGRGATLWWGSSPPRRYGSGGSWPGRASRRTTPASG